MRCGGEFCKIVGSAYPDPLPGGTPQRSTAWGRSLAQIGTPVGNSGRSARPSAAARAARSTMQMSALAARQVWSGGSGSTTAAATGCARSSGTCGFPEAAERLGITDPATRRRLSRRRWSYSAWPRTPAASAMSWTPFSASPGRHRRSCPACHVVRGGRWNSRGTVWNAYMLLPVTRFERAWSGERRLW
jgi:hypothetical protein